MPPITINRHALKMLAGGARAAPHFLSPPHSSTAAATPSLFLRHQFKPFSAAPSQPSIKMSSSSTTTQFIEHIVLFKVKPDAEFSKVNSMINNLNSLVSLDPVLHLSAGPILRNRSSALAFTHMLHSRYLTKSDLASYSQHPDHVRVVKDYVSPVVEDIMAVDWVADDVTGAASVQPGSAMRVTFMKLKENAGEDEKGKVLGVVGGIKEKFSAIDQLTVGENFSPGRAKGFSIASIAVFKELSELEGLEKESELANEQKDKVRDSLDGVVVVDYVLPNAQSASL